MREILFRGKRIDTGEWVYGFYVRLHDSKGNESHRIYPGYAETDCGDYYPDWYEVESETIGQFTGLTDKNGKNIFEGDMIVSYDLFGYKENCGIVGWNELFVAWHMDDHSMYSGSIASYEVIGSIHDERELP